VRKRSWKEAVEAAAPQPELAVAKAAPQLSNGLLHPPVRPASSGIFNAASAQLELAEKSRDSCNEASKLTSEVAFWLRHLTIPMARTLTSTNGVVQKQSPPEKQLSNGADDANSSPTPDEGSSDGSDNETLPRWPGIDSVMVLYMAHQQELVGETKFLREHCERLHVQLAEGQATLSKLCLTLSSLVETQRKFKEEDNPTMMAIDELQNTLKLLQSPH